MEWQPALDSINPANPDAAVRFVSLLREVHQRSGISYDQLVKRSIENKKTSKTISLSTGAISGNLNKNGLPPLPFVTAYLQAEGRPDTEIKRWKRLWGDIACLKAQPLDDHIARLQSEVEALKHDADDLESQKQRLNDQLETEIEKRQHLEREIATLQAELESARQRADGLENELSERLAARQYERATIEIHIQAVRTELRIVDEQHGRTEGRHIRLRDEVSKLDEDSAIRDELLNLYRQRAEHLDAELATTKTELDGAVQILTRYLDKERNESTPAPETAIAPLVNSDVTVGLPVTDVDFPSIQNVTVRFRWYCTKCKRGGRLRYDECPHCHNHALLHDHPVPFEVPLPSMPRYSQTRRLEGQGNYDAPSALQGAICVLVIRRS